jgi:ABC-type glutathione transport system ATPase component
MMPDVSSRDTNEENINIKDELSSYRKLSGKEYAVDV